MTSRNLFAVFFFGMALFGFEFPVGAGEADQGREVYLQYCSSCHGSNGRGSGTVSSYMKIRIPDLTALSKKNKGVYPMARVMSAIDGSRAVRGHGEPKMPVWGELFEKEAAGQKYPQLSSLLKVKLVAEYISSLQR